MTDLGIIRRIGLAIGLGLLASGLVITFNKQELPIILAVSGAVLLGLIAPGFQKK